MDENYKLGGMSMGEHCKMSRQQRAKQFAPFSALKGYEDALRIEENIMLENMDSTTEVHILSNLVDKIKKI